MTDVIVRGTVLGWESDEFPGWIEVVVTDEAGRSHHIIEKVPILTTRNITSASVFPGELWLRATYKRMEGDDVIVNFDQGVETIEGLDELAVAAADVRWL
ncbi:hypothetical protein GCM10027053_18510 [Intrasporangium mesophilum]